MTLQSFLLTNLNQWAWDKTHAYNLPEISLKTYINGFYTPFSDQMLQMSVLWWKMEFEPNFTVHICLIPGVSVTHEFMVKEFLKNCSFEEEVEIFDMEYKSYRNIPDNLLHSYVKNWYFSEDNNKCRVKLSVDSDSFPGK